MTQTQNPRHEEPLAGPRYLSRAGTQVLDFTRTESVRPAALHALSLGNPWYLDGLITHVRELSSLTGRAAAPREFDAAAPKIGSTMPFLSRGPHPAEASHSRTYGCRIGPSVLARSCS